MNKAASPIAATRSGDNTLGIATSPASGALPSGAVGSVWSVRPMQTCDLPGVLRLQAEAYPEGYLENGRAYQSKLAAYPQGCMVASQATELGGYLVAIPSCFGQPPLLNAASFSTAPGSNTLHLHDLAVGMHTRGQGIAASLIRRFLDLFEHSSFCHATLIAVQGSQTFWERQGFRVDDTLTSAPMNDWGYGVDAVYMSRERILASGC